MTEQASAQTFPPMHPVTRLGRVIQQLRSFGDLHANELEVMAADLDASSANEPAARLRLYRDLQRDEAQLVLDELLDIRADLSSAASQAAPQVAHAPAGAEALRDPAINSPRRARWLAEQAAEAERRKQPFSRRSLLGGSGAPIPEDQ